MPYPVEAPTKKNGKMNTRIILKDLADERQPRLQLLNSKKRNWRLYWNVQKEPGNPGEEKEQWTADHVPQTWQQDVISEERPSPEAFRPLLKELGLTDNEIEDIINE